MATRVQRLIEGLASLVVSKGRRESNRSDHQDWLQSSDALTRLVDPADTFVRCESLRQRRRISESDKKPGSCQGRQLVHLADRSRRRRSGQRKRPPGPDDIMSIRGQECPYQVTGLAIVRTRTIGGEGESHSDVPTCRRAISLSARRQRTMDGAPAREMSWSDTWTTAFEGSVIRSRYVTVPVMRAAAAVVEGSSGFRSRVRE
jgi:hypothetical protein